MWLFCMLMESGAQTVAIKPPAGAVLNPQHPMANGLIVCPLINEGAGQTLWESSTRQAFVMDNPLIWTNLPGSAQYPWAGPALLFNGTPGTTMGPGCRIDVSTNSFFQTEPSGTTGLSIAYLWSPSTGAAQSARRIGDTDKTSVYTIYESISGNANKWTYTYRDAANTVQLKHFPYTVGDWIFCVVCIKEGECKIYTNSVLASTSTDINFHNTWWHGNAILPIWWHMTEGKFFYTNMNAVVFGGSLAGAWIWNRYLTQTDVTSLYQSPWGMFTYTNTLTIVSDHGGMNPGSVATNFGTVLNCLITNSPATSGTTQYVANGGAVLSNAFALVSTTNLTLTLTNNAILTWAWNTNVFLTLGTNGAGTVNQTNGWWALGSNVTVTATASNHWHFTGWSGDTNGCSRAGNVITAAMAQARWVCAAFAMNLITNGPAGTATPEIWLANYYGSTNYDIVNTNDTDHDSMPAWAEYIAGTDPTDPLSVLRIDEMFQQSTGMVISWATTTGRLYGLDLRPSLTSGDWTNVPGWTNVLEASGRLTFTNFTPGTGSFYRVNVRVEP